MAAERPPSVSPVMLTHAPSLLQVSGDGCKAQTSIPDSAGSLLPFQYVAMASQGLCQSLRSVLWCSLQPQHSDRNRERDDWASFIQRRPGAGLELQPPRGERPHGSFPKNQPGPRIPASQLHPQQLCNGGIILGWGAYVLASACGSVLISAGSACLSLP
ncbi:c-C motif chemokine 4-like [Platysternon megacephalum]|uniref:C-C motif chemokine 4-like n=1 Tax=Platysternon megacephalum TaxID=55544 RepID=A0A4D9DGN2_9SAUR|nr:c-C motif chemokine 4-like [Platysternon megacephalum]